MLNKAEIIKLVNNLNLPNYEYWVTAGAGLVLHEVKEFTHDIDIGCTTKVLDNLLKEGNPLSFTSDEVRSTKCGEVTEFFENWFADEVEMIDGICVASLLSIRKHKSFLGRGKDLRDIALIDDFIRDRKNNRNKISEEQHMTQKDLAEKTGLKH